MSVMLYKVSEGKSLNKVKVAGVSYDYIIVDDESAEETIKKGWMDRPVKPVEEVAPIVEEVVEVVEAPVVEEERLVIIDADKDGLIDGSDEKEELRDEYKEKSGNKPDGRWNVAKLKEKIAEL